MVRVAWYRGGMHTPVAESLGQPKTIMWDPFRFHLRRAALGWDAVYRRHRLLFKHPCKHWPRRVCHSRLKWQGPAHPREAPGGKRVR